MGINFKKKYDRLKKRYTQKSIAKRIGISQTYLSLILNGKRKPSEEIINKLEQELS